MNRVLQIVLIFALVADGLVAKNAAKVFVDGLHQLRSEIGFCLLVFLFGFLVFFLVICLYIVGFGLGAVVDGQVGKVSVTSGCCSSPSLLSWWWRRCSSSSWKP